MNPDNSAGMHGNRLEGSSYMAEPRDAADLDAAEPLLRSSDIQRLNRKAIVFLAGIVALLVVSVLWMVSGPKAGSQAASRPTEKVVIPELPPAPPASEVPPIPVAPMPVAHLPSADAGRFFRRPSRMPRCGRRPPPACSSIATVW